VTFGGAAKDSGAPGSLSDADGDGSVPLSEANATAATTRNGTAAPVAMSAARRVTGSIARPYRWTTGQVSVRVMPWTD